MKQAAFGRNGQYGNGAVLSLCYQVGAFHGIYSNIHFFSAGTYMFADVEHGRFIDFPFADDYGTGNGSLGKLFMHAVHSSLVSAFLIAYAHETAAPKSCLFRDSYKFHRKLSVHCMPPQ